jgi:hypothetical protein
VLAPGENQALAITELLPEAAVQRVDDVKGGCMLSGKEAPTLGVIVACVTVNEPPAAFSDALYVSDTQAPPVGGCVIRTWTTSGALAGGLGVYVGVSKKSPLVIATTPESPSPFPTESTNSAVSSPVASTCRTRVTSADGSAVGL